jgi:rare lipoprotein A
VLSEGIRIENRFCRGDCTRLCLVSSAAAETCIASQYGVGDGYHGRRTASGARFNTIARDPFTVAHKSPPFGTWLTII